MKIVFKLSLPYLVIIHLYSFIMFKKVARSQSFVEPPNPPKKESVTKILPDEISSRILDLEM